MIAEDLKIDFHVKDSRIASPLMSVKNNGTGKISFKFYAKGEIGMPIHAENSQEIATTIKMNFLNIMVLDNDTSLITGDGARYFDAHISTAEESGGNYTVILKQKDIIPAKNQVFTIEIPIAVTKDTPLSKPANGFSLSVNCLYDTGDYQDRSMMYTYTQSDTDGDNIIDAIDIDDDNDGILDSIENMTAKNNGDTDGDNIPDSSDLDSDNDGITDLEESLGSLTLAKEIDANNDGKFDIPLNGNVNENGTIQINTQPINSDGDITPDYQDTDSDNDGVSDLDEGNGDSDMDGIPDYRDAIEDEDFDKDGIPDIYDEDDDNDGILDSVEERTAPNNGDTDGDGMLDIHDLDSDNDGISDLEESGLNANELDLDHNGIIDSKIDGNQNGIMDVVDPKLGAKSIKPVNNDNDVTPNFQDIDSDNDDIFDIYEGTLDTDNDGILNYLDQDSDNDGMSDREEGTGDRNNDGIPNYLDAYDAVPDYRMTVRLDNTNISIDNQNVDIVIMISEYFNGVNNGKLEFSIAKNNNFSITFDPYQSVRFGESFDNNNWRMTTTNAHYIFTYIGNSGKFPAKSISSIALSGKLDVIENARGTHTFGANIYGGTGETVMYNNDDKDTLTYNFIKD